MVINKLLLLGLMNFSVVSTTPILDITADKLEYKGDYGGPSDPNHRIAYIIINTEFTLSATQKATIQSDFGNETLAFKISSESGYKKATNIKGEINERNKNDIGNSSGWTTKFTDSDYLFSESIYYDTNTTFNNLFEKSMIAYETTFYFRLYFELGKTQLNSRILYALNKDGTIQITSGNEIATHAEYWKGFEAGYQEGRDNGYSRGEEEGYIKGYEDAEDYYKNLNGGDSPLFNFFGMLGQAANSLGGILDTQVFPNITIGTLIAIPIVVAIIGFILKFIT